MNLNPKKSTNSKPIHSWLRKINIAFVPGSMTPLLKEVTNGLLQHARLLGHRVQKEPDDNTDLMLATARFDEVVNWRDSVLISGRRRYKLSHTPTFCTLTHISLSSFQFVLEHFRTSLAKEPPDPADYKFPGLAPQAYRVLIEQGRRGGPILALERLIQSQSKSLRGVLVVGDKRPLFAYNFDLAGAFPRSEAEDLESFYHDVVLRIVTTVSTYEVTEHQFVNDPIPANIWSNIKTPSAMRTAGQQLKERNFFTEMIRIFDLVQVPTLGETVSNQYSEGCFATWDSTLKALVATVTSSAQPVNKGEITEDDLAVIVGMRPDGSGTRVRPVEGKDNLPPSSEALEMIEMDLKLPTITLGTEWDSPDRVPVARSKLHGHRGVAAYNPDQVEFIPLDSPYYHYLVSCATRAQAEGVRDAFARSQTLRNPQDPRPVVFTVLPGHGLVIVEKWVAGKAPFQIIWEFMDSGDLEVENRIPQGPMKYAPGPDGIMLLETAEEGCLRVPP